MCTIHTRFLIAASKLILQPKVRAARSDLVELFFNKKEKERKSHVECKNKSLTQNDYLSEVVDVISVAIS